MDRMPLPRHLLNRGLLDHPVGNMIKSTTEMYLMAAEKGDLTNYDIFSYQNGVNTILRDLGLLNRYRSGDPRNEVELDQHDNYMSLCCSTGIHKKFSMYSRDMLKYGLKHFFHYNNCPNKKLTLKEWISCFCQPYHIAIMFLNAGILWTLAFLITGIGFLCLAHLWGAILIEAYRKNGTSGKLLMWQLYHARMPMKFLVALPLSIFKKRLISDYKAFNRVFYEYYGPDSQVHEIAMYGNSHIEWQ